jgi:alcohol dehydrogenase class IV
MTPITPFSLRLPPRIRFGRGAALEVVPEIAGFGQRLLLVHGRSPSRAAALRQALEVAGCRVTAMACPGEPTLDLLEDALRAAQPERPEAVVAIGGGAALDLGKALAALLPGETAPLDHLEVVGAGQPLTAAPLPCIAIPTTAGTGSEATKNAVIGVPAHARKVSLRDDRIVPALAVIDPALTDGTPLPQTLASGLDAVTQVIEPYLSTRATPLTDALARPAIRDGLEALVTLVERGEDAGARDRLAYVAHVSGMALANAGLGVVHGLAGPMGGETGAPHGAICARLLPKALRALDRAEGKPAWLRERVAEVLDLVAEIVPGGVSGMAGWLTAHGVPEVAVACPAQRARIAAAAVGSSSMKSSAVRFSSGELEALIA